MTEADLPYIYIMEREVCIHMRFCKYSIERKRARARTKLIDPEKATLLLLPLLSLPESASGAVDMKVAV